MIHSLRLKNFKAFEEQLIKFRPLTLMSGFNNTGKSSALQSLLLLRQSYTQGVLNKCLVLNGDLLYMGTAQDVIFEGAKDKFIQFEILGHHQEEKSWQWCFAYDPVTNILETQMAPATSEIEKLSLFGSCFHYLLAERTSGECTAHLSVFGNCNIPNQLCHPQAKSLCLKDQVEAWMGEISPGTKIYISSNEDTDLISLKYSFETKNHISKKYRASNVGFGISHTLPIIVALLASPPHSLIIIEYPEGHLHPSGQTKIAKLIALAASSGIQVVIETHSDHILNGIRLSVHGSLIKPDDVQLNYFQRRETQDKVVTEVISPRIDKNGRIDRWPDGFFDELEKNLVVLLKPAGH